MAAISHSGSFGGDGTRRCSYCGRREELVTHLVRARGAYICDSCVSLASEAISIAPPEGRLLRIRPVRSRYPIVTRSN